MPAFIPSARAADTPEARQEKLRQLIEMAFWHSDTGNIDSAILACRAALSVDPACVSALSLLGSLYEKLGETDLAIEAFERVVELNPNSVAEIEKLELLQAGVHREAFTPPRVYRWLPPAVTQFFLTHKRAPVVVAVSAAVIVFALGIAGLSTIVTALHRPVMTPRPSIAPQAAAVPVLASPKPSSTVAAVPVPASPAASPQAFPAAVPTASSAAPPSNPNGGFMPLSQVARLRRESMDRQQAASDRPSQIKALPKGNAGSSSMPSVSTVKPLDAPNVVASVASVGDIPSHTVVVAAPSAGASPAPEFSNTEPSAPPPPAPRISIRFFGPSENGGDVPGDSTNGARSRSAGGHRAAELQAKALSLQNAGNYDQALTAYRGAIAAYQSDINRGANVDVAKRGIDACQTGIQICKQSE